MEIFNQYSIKVIYFIKIYCVILLAWEKSPFGQTLVSSST